MLSLPTSVRILLERLDAIAPMDHPSPAAAAPRGAPPGHGGAAPPLRPVEPVQEVGPPRIGLGWRVGVVLQPSGDLDDPAHLLVVRLEPAQLQEPQEPVEPQDSADEGPEAP